MAHCGYIGKIKPGKVDDYVKAHEEVWPELIQVMKKAGLEKEICFLYGNHVFFYREAADLDGALDKLSREPLNQKWDEYMASILEKPTTDSSDFFLQMKEVFCM